MNTTLKNNRCWDKASINRYILLNTRVLCSEDDILWNKSNSFDDVISLQDLGAFFQCQSLVEDLFQVFKEPIV